MPQATRKYVVKRPALVKTVTKWIYRENKWIEVEKFPQEGAGGHEADGSDAVRHGESGPGHWHDRMRSLLGNPATVADLFALFSEFDEHNRQAKNNYKFAQHVGEICNAFSERFPTGTSHPAGEVGAPFLWHLLVKLGQYLNFLPPDERSDARKTMNDVWIFLGRSSVADLHVLSETPPELLRHDGLFRPNFFPGPLQDICEGQTMWERWFHSGKRAAVELALAIYVVCHVVGKKLHDDISWRFSWRTCLDAFQQSLGERVPDCLQEVLRNKQEVLSAVTDPLDLPHFAKALSCKWSPRDVMWCARTVIHSSVFANFLNFYILQVHAQSQTLDTWLEFLQDAGKQVATSTFNTLLLGIAVIHCKGSVPNLLLNVVMPCKWRLSTHRQLLEHVAAQLRLHEQVWPEFAEVTGGEGWPWLHWLFGFSCRHVASIAFNAKAQAQRLQASVHMVHQMHTGLEQIARAQAKLASSACAVSIEEFGLAELDVTITTLRRWGVDPLPALLAFLATSACHFKDAAAVEKVTRLVLEAQQASTKDSMGWHYLCSEGVRAFRAPAASNTAPTPPWVLRLAGTLAAQYSDAAAVKQAPSHAEGFIRELQGPLLNEVIQCNAVVKTVFGVVCLRKLSKTLAEVTGSVLDGCYDISTIWSNLLHSPLLLQVLHETVSPLEDELAVDDVDVWKEFKRTVKLVLMMDCQSISRTQLAALNQSQTLWIGIATALGHLSVPVECWETAAFDKALEELQEAADVAEWLATFNVDGAANHAGCLATAPAAGLTMEQLAGKQKQLDSFLLPIAVHLQMITHCRKAGSVIFDIAIKGLCQDAEADGVAGGIDMMIVRQWICECDRQLRSLLSQEMRLEEAKRFFLQRKMNIRQEVEKLVALPRYQEYAAGRAQESIEMALEMLQYSTETSEVAQLIYQYGLLQDPANDPGFLQLEVSQRCHATSSLKDAPLEFRHLKELFSAQGRSLTGVHFQLFQKLRKCPEVIAFFRENNFAMQGSQRFEQARQRLTVQLQAQDLETKLLNDVIEVRELIVPFVIEHNSFADFIRAVLAGRISYAGLIARLDLVQANIGRVKLWFQSALSTKVESAAVQAALVNETGRMEIELGRLLLRPTAVSVHVEVEGQQIRMNEEEIRELNQQLALSVRPVRRQAAELAAAEDGARDRTSAMCKRCLDKLCAAMKLYDFACALESHGHPQYQARRIAICLSDRQGRDGVQDIMWDVQAYEKRLLDWRHLLQEQKQACPFLAAFDARELLLMHILLDGDTSKARGISQLMSGQSIQPTPTAPEASARANDDAKELAAQGLAGFLRSVRGLAQHRELQELDAPVEERGQGSERRILRQGLQGLQRLARLFVPNLRQEEPGAPGDGEGQYDDPRTCLRRLARFLERNLLAVEAPRPAASQGGDDRFQMVANVKCGNEFVPLMSLLQHIFRNEKSTWSTRCILWCDAVVSQDGISAFMQRIEAFPTHSFAFLGVNRLTAQIQQMVCDFQKRQSEKGPRQGRIVYAYLDVEAAPAADFLAPYPSVPHRSLAELRDKFQEMRHEWAGTVRVICGLPGCGKSTRARTSNAGRPGAASAVTFLDELDLRRIHAGLASLYQTSETAGAVVRIDISDRADWMGVNRALFDLFVFGVWRNLEDGTLYATRSSQNYLVEVPFCGEGQDPMTVQENLQKYFPALVACADADVEELTETSEPFEVDEKTRFIAKFWKPFRTRDVKGRVPLNKPCFNDAPVTHPDLETDGACREEFLDLIRDMHGLRKRQQQCLQRFLHRRFQFFESPLYQYNSGAVPFAGQARGRGLNDLGSRIMKQMVREARMLCEPGFVCSARDAPCSILVYDQGFALKPCWADNDRHVADLMPLVEEGHVELQALSGQHERCCALLRWRLQLLEGEVEELSRECGFVLVKDFAFKLLCICERKEAGIPVIIEGVTGVGKTFVLKFLARLLNHRLLKKDSDVEEAPRVVWRFKTWLRSHVLPLISNRERVSGWQKQLLEGDCTVDSMVELWQEMVEEQRQEGHAAALAAVAVQQRARDATAAPAAGAVGAAEPAARPAAGDEGAEAAAAGAAGGDRGGQAPALLREQVVLWLEQVPLVKPDASLLNLLDEAAHQPEVSGDLLRAFLNIELHDVFYRLLLHPDMSSTAIEAFVGEIATRAMRSPVATFVVLFDELNTSSALGLLKAVVVDHKLNGIPLPSNIFFVGCINPHKHVERNTRGQQEYMVHALPASMAELRWQYPPLRDAELEEFVTEKIRRFPTRAAGPLSGIMTAAFAKMICVCQAVFSEILGESSVSQRDVQRCLTILNFFWDLRLPSSSEYDEEAPNDKLVRCMVLSLAIVYYFRIADDETYGSVAGGDLRVRLDERLRAEVPHVRLCFREEVDRAMSRLISSETFNIPEGVALNRDLRENLFACLVSVETKVPVCLLGPPGRSKTLAFEVLTQNLLGERSTAEFCRNFQAVDPIVYQCSHGSTGQEISGVLRRAAEREAGYMADGGRMRCVVFLDEGGLPPDHRMALKVLHDPLDDGGLPIIVASNRALDAANQGRMLTVARQAQTQEDYELMGRELLAPAGSPVPPPLRCLVRGLASAFLQLQPNLQQSFTDRDFVSLLRHLRVEAAEGRHSCPTAAAVLRGLENNFFKPGVDVQVIAELFFAELNSEFEQSKLCDFRLPVNSYRKPLEIMADCIHGGQGAACARGVSLRSRHPHLAPRFCMILDGGEDDAVVRLLLQEGLLPHSLEVLHVPTAATHGEDDLDILAVNQMARLQHCMESGQPVLLRNASRILIPFYNLFNQNYRVTQTDEGEQLLYIIVAHGARTHFCRVHPDFFVVLHMPLSEYAMQPEPLKSRFAQVQVTVDEVRELRLEARLAHELRRDFVQQAFDRCHDFVEHAVREVGSSSAFAGLQPRQTVESLCLLHLDCFVDALAGRALPSRISPLCDLSGSGVELAQTGLDGAVQMVLLHLLQIARPESLLQVLGTLGNEKLYRWAYFHCQHHFSLPGLLRSALSSCQDGDKKMPKLLVQTRTSSEVLRLLKLQSRGGAAGPAANSSGKNLWAEIGLAADDVHVLDFDEVDSAAYLEDRIAAGAQKRVVLLGVDMLGRSNANVTWLRDVIDHFAADQPEVLFVLLLHFPPEKVLSGLGMCPCTFLDHWEFFFLDSVGFRTPFREDLLVQVLCAGEALEDLPPLIRHDISFEAVTMDFARRALLPLGVRPPRVADKAEPHVRAAARFYEAGAASTEERAAALREVLHQKPAIWKQLVTAFHESCRAGNVSEELMTLAERIRRGEQLMSFMDAALLRLRRRFDGVALAFLAQLCANEGLVGLAEDATGATASLLRLMPMPKGVEVASSVRIPIQSQKSRAGLSPLLCLLHHQLLQHLKRLGLLSPVSSKAHGTQASVLDALMARIEQDPALHEFCTHVETAVLQDYARFVVQLTCGRSLSPRLGSLLLNWTAAGAVGDQVPVPASLAQLVAVTGLQGGRLGSLARVTQMLESTFDRLGVLDSIPIARIAAPAPVGRSGGGAADPGDWAASFQGVEMWRLEVESKASAALEEAAWLALLHCAAPDDDADTPWEWVAISHRTEHALQTAVEWCRSSGSSSTSKQRLLMRALASVLPALENADNLALARSLCARAEAFEGAEEAPVWLIHQVADLLQHEPVLLKQALAMLLFGLLDEKSIWSREPWVMELFALMEKEVAGATAAGDDDIQQDFLVAEDLALLLLRELRSRVMMASGGAEHGLNRQDPNSWPLLRRFLESQGMAGCYFPRYSPERQAAAAVRVPRVADLLFTVHCLDLVTCEKPSVEVLQTCFFNAQRFAGCQAPDKSILAQAHGYAFALTLGRWLCRAETAEGIDAAMLAPVNEMLQEAAASILPSHIVPLALEVQNCGGGGFLQGLLRNESVVRAMPRLRELLLDTGLCSPDAGADLPGLQFRSPPLPLCLTSAHASSPLGDLRPHYGRICEGLAAALQQADPGPLREALSAAAAAPLGAGHSKGLFLLAIYHEYYSERRNPDVLLAPVLGWLPRLLPDTGEEELRFFRCLIAPATHQLGYSAHGTASNDLNAAFALDCREPLQVAVRHCLVNILALSFFVPAAQRDHFWMHANTPGDLHGRFAFGSSLATTVEGTHYDCGCVFGLDGSFQHSQACPHWPLQAATASYVHCYGGFCLNYLVDPRMHGALHGPVLTPSSIRAGGRERFLDMAGARPEDATVQFCYQRVCTSVLYLQASLGLRPEEQCTLLSLVCELGVSKLLAGTSRLKFQYDTADEKRAAEAEFRDAFLDTVGKRDEIFEALRKNGAESLKKLCPPSGNVTGGSFEAALARAPATPTVQVLQRFSATRSDLELVSLVPPLLRLYSFIHEELNQHRQGSLTVQAAAETTLFAAVEDFVRAAARTPEQRQRSKELCKEGVDAFNLLSEKLGGMLVIECGRDEIPIAKIGPETSLMLVLSCQQAPGSEDVLYRALEHLLKLRQDFLDAVERAAAEPAAPGILRRVQDLKGNMELTHLVHMPLALAEECRLTVPNFVHRQCSAGYDAELLLPTVLRASVVGKSCWALSEVQRDFHLLQQQPVMEAELAAAAAPGEEERQTSWASMPDCFNVLPVGDARAEIEACLQSFRQSELLELLGLLSRASSFMQRWRDAEGSRQLASRLREAGFELPGHCHEALQSPQVQIKHTGFILKQLQDRLESRSFTFVHLPSRLRRPLPAGLGARLDNFFENICHDPAAVDEVIAYFSAYEDRFLQQEARPLLAVVEETAPEAPSPLREALPSFPQEVLCRHLFETLLRLLALRLRLADNSSSASGADAGRVVKWWESMAALPDLPEDAAADAASEGSDGEGWELVGVLPELPETVQAMLRRCLQRRYQYLHCRPAVPTGTMVEEEVEHAEPAGNMFKVTQMEEVAMRRAEEVQHAQSVLLRFLRRWLLQHRSVAVQQGQEEGRGSLAGASSRAPGGDAVHGEPTREGAAEAKKRGAELSQAVVLEPITGARDGQVRPGGQTELVDELGDSKALRARGHEVKLLLSVCPPELLSTRASLPPSGDVTVDPSSRQAWKVRVGDTELPPYRMIGTRVFGKVCEANKLPLESTTVVSADGLCEDDPRAPTRTTLRFVPEEEILECEALGRVVRFHGSAKLEALAACVLRQNPDVASCFVTNSSLQLQPLTSRLSDVEQPVRVMDGGTRQCWQVVDAEGIGYLAMTANVACLTRLGLNAMWPCRPLRVWSPSLGVLRDSDPLQLIGERHDFRDVCLIPAAEVIHLNIDLFGVQKSLEVPISTTAREVIHLLLSATDSAATLGTATTPAQLVLLADGKDLHPEDPVVGGDGQVDQLQLSMVATVEHFARARGCRSVRLATGMTAGALLAQMDHPQQTFCLVSTDHQLIAASIELWKAPHKFGNLSVCMPSVVSVRTVSGELKELRLGCTAGLPSIHKAAQDAGLIPQNASLLWSCGASSCWPGELRSCLASALDLQDELAFSRSEELGGGQRPAFVVTKDTELIQFNVAMMKEDGDEELLLPFWASADSVLRDLQAQLATLLHLPGKQVLHGGAGEVLDDEDRLVDILSPEEEEQQQQQLPVLRLQRPSGAACGSLHLRVLDAHGHACEFQLGAEEDVVGLWRLVRWNFGLAPLDFREVFDFSGGVGVFCFGEEDECPVEELRSAFEEQGCEVASVTCTDVCGMKYTFTLEWRA